MIQNAVLQKSAVNIRWQIPRKKRLPAKKVFDHEEIVQGEGGLLLPLSRRENFEGGQLPKIYESDHCARCACNSSDSSRIGGGCKEKKSSIEEVL